MATIIGTDSDDVLQGTFRADVIVGLDGNDTIIGASGEDTICGGDGDDTIHGQSQADTIFGEAGNDTITGADGADVIDGGHGNDSIRGDSQDDTLRGGDGDDTITGASGADTIDGGLGNDMITGDSQNDVIHGGDGDDDINGGSGDDTLDGGNGVDVVNGLWNNDTCDDAETAINCELETQNGEETTGGGDPTDPEPDPPTCNGLVATIIGTDEDDELAGTDGDDVIVALGGLDTIFAGDGNDVVCGGDGDDLIFAGAGNDTIDGEAGADIILGATGDDDIDGSDGVDFLSGGEGEDVLIGGAGLDSCTDPQESDLSNASCEEIEIDITDPALADSVSLLSEADATDSEVPSIAPGDVDVVFADGSDVTAEDLSMTIDFNRLRFAADRMVSAPFDLSIPDDRSFVTAELTLEYSPEALPGLVEADARIYFFNETYDLWELVPGEQQVDALNNTVTATLTHFSTYAVLALPDTGFDVDPGFVDSFRLLNC